MTNTKHEQEEQDGTLNQEVYEINTEELNESINFSEAYKEVCIELESLKDQLLRLAAESDNYRKRSIKQIEDAGKFAINNFAKEMIEVLDNLYLATDNIPIDELEVNKNLSLIYQGVELTKTNLINILAKHGVKRIMPEIGEAFDHNIHQAVSHVSDPNIAENSISSVMRAGYVIHERLLKPAMVIVAKTTQS